MLPVIDNTYRPSIDAKLPYTLGLMHGCAHNYGNTAALAIPYLEALLELRMPGEAIPPGKPVPLKDIDFDSGWRGDYASVHGNYATIATPDEYSGEPQDMVWLPNRAAAYAWRAWQTRESPVDITISANGTLLHNEFVPKQVTKIHLTEGDQVELGINIRREGVAPTKIAFWDEDRELGAATNRSALLVKATTGILHVYASYEVDGRKAVTNPMQIIIDDAITAAAGIGEDEAQKVRRTRDSVKRVLEDQLPALEALKLEAAEAQRKRDNVYDKYRTTP